MWTIALCVTGLLFWLAFRLWLNGDEARALFIDELRREDEQDWIEWEYEYTPYNLE